MPVNSVGDMAQHFMSMRNGSGIKSDLARLSESMSSGRVSDITRHLGGETARLSGINHSLTQLSSYAQAGRETEQTLATMQTVLNQVGALRETTGGQLLLVSNNSSEDQVNEAARASSSTFGTMVNLLNTRVGDRAIFGGAEVAMTTLAKADTMVADIQAAIGGATSQAAISAIVSDWFDSPTGGFSTMGYAGDTGPELQKRVSANTSLVLDARADDPAIRTVLKFAAMAAIVDEMPSLPPATRTGLLQEAGAGFLGSASALVAVQARIGFGEATVSQEMAEMSAQGAALEIAKNNLISADPFDTASRLQSVQIQLETHYAVTARLSQLSLLRYMS